MQTQLPEPFTPEYFTPIRCEKQHSIALAQGEITFRSVVEDFVFYDEQGRPEASICTISYLRSGVSGPRPVLFLWNGGPGSATSMLHLECFGPFQIETQGEEKCFGLETDPACLLDVCDLVFLDPVGVGYSRLLNPQKAEKYFCTDGDARSTAFAVTHWLRRHNRWDSPLYLCGESYGTVRACRVLAELGRSPVSESRMVLGVPVAGVILIGLATSIGVRGGELTEPGLSLTSAALPSMAAVHWYHNLRGRGQAALEDCVAQAWRFAKDELAPALFEGDDCPESAVRRLSARLAALTGMEEAYFVQNRLLLRSMEDFMTQVIRQKGQRVDLYDARMAFSVSQPYNAIGDANVPLAVMNGLLAPRLGVQTDRLYYTGNLTVHPGWKYETEDLGERRKTHLGCLRAAMQANPHMRVLAASGLYDLCTLAGNTRYALSHSGIPKDRLTAREYPGGHGVYSSAEGKSAFLQDARALIAPQNH